MDCETMMLMMIIIFMHDESGDTNACFFAMRKNDSCFEVRIQPRTCLETVRHSPKHKFYDIIEDCHALF